MTVTVQCNAPCQTCNSATPNTCLSCITNTAPGGGPYYLQQTSCVESCGTSYLLVGLVCQACTNNCFTCQTSLDRCTSCTGAYSLKANTCITDCGDGFFSSSNVCNACDSSVNCRTCTGAANVCTSCIGNLLLQGSQCKNQCDRGFVADQNNVCQQCTGNCANCVSTVDNCIECVSNFFLSQGSCVSSCPTGTSIANLTTRTCDACDSTCGTCLGTTSTCVTCQPGLLKLASTCIATCPSGTTVPVSGVCQSCSLTCATCQTTVSNCITCPSGQFKVISSSSSQSTCAVSCPSGYTPSQGNCIFCGDGFQINSNGDGCEAIPTVPSQQSNISFVIFPFLIAAMVGVALAGISKLVEKNSYFCSTIAIFWAFVEIFALATQTALAFLDSQTMIFIVTGACLLMLILCNILFSICYCTKMKKDIGFSKSFLKHKKCFRLIAFASNIFNYKIIRFHYAYCFGVKAFQHQFSNVSDNFLKPLFAVTLMSIVIVNLPIIILDLSMVIFTLSYGQQLFITCIETLILQLLIIIISVPQMISFRNPQFGIRQFGFYDQINDQVDDYSKEERFRALQKLLDNNRDRIPQFGEDDDFDENDVDDEIRSRLSDNPQIYAEQYLNERAQKRQTLSDPPSPRTRRQKQKELEMLDDIDKEFVIEYPDNVYFEAKEGDPNYRQGKKLKEKGNQTQHRNKRRILNELGELETIYSEVQRDSDEEDDVQSFYDPQEKQEEEEDPNEAERLRKQAEQQEFKREMNQKYNNVNKDMDDIRDKLNNHEIGINAMILKKQAEEKKKQDERTRLEQEELKNLEEEAALQELEDHPEYQHSMGDSQKQSPRIFLGGPQNQEINQLYGNQKMLKKKSSAKLKDLNEQSMEELQGFDTLQDRGSLAAITVPGGGGTTIGEPDHDLALLYPDLQNLQIAPDFIDIDDIRGDLHTDHAGNMIITRNENGDFVDKKGRRVNKLGFLLDDQDRVINSQGEVVDVLGDFDKDKHGNVKLIPDPAQQSAEGDFIDKQGRPVNDKGYLIDREHGHIIDSQGSIVAKKGEFDFGPDGNPIILLDPHGNQIDKNNRPVNGKGFLVDNHGNIINDNKQITFKQEELSQQEPFEILPTEQPKKKRRSSIVTKEEEQMMNQIEEAHGDRGMAINSDNDDFNGIIQKQLDNMRPKSGNSSVNQLMQDTPTFYNHMNQRFEPTKNTKSQRHLDPRKKKKNVPLIVPNYHQFHPGLHNSNIEEDQNDESSFDLEEEDDIEKLTKKRKLKPKKYHAPRQQDRQMAGIYGGAPQGPLVRRKLKNHGSRAAVRKLPKKSQLDNITNSVSGFGTQHSTLPGMQRGGLGIRSGTGLNNSQFITGPMGTSMQADLNDQVMGQLNFGTHEHKSRVKKVKRKPRPGSRNSDLQKIYRHQDDFESEQNSQFNQSNYSKRTSGTRIPGQRITALETIYLQRINPARSQSRKGGLKSHSAAPGGRIMSNAMGHGVTRSKQPQFRQMWDRNHDDPSKLINTESERDERNFLGEFSKQGSKLMGNDSARGGGNNYSSTNPNIFSGNLPKYQGEGENSARGQIFQKWMVGRKQ